MKLDLFNSRPLPFKKPELVYDSICGETIKDPTHTSTFSGVSAISFNATYERTDYFPKSCAPNTFSRSKIDHRGNIVDMENLLSPKPQKTIGGKVQSTFGRVDLESEEMERQAKNKRIEEAYLPTLEKIKDKLYSPNYETLDSRVKGGKLPGANWSEVSREVKITPAYTGDDNLDKFAFERSKYGRRQIAVKFNDIPTGRGEVSMPEEDAKSIAKELMPLKLRRRVERMEASDADKETRLIERKLKINKSLSHLSVDEFKNSFDGTILGPQSSTASRDSLTRQSTGVVKFNDIHRFDNPHYRQENYVKTSGMLLDNDWDKKLDKKIMTGFNKGNTPLHIPKANNGDSDVDVGYLFSTGYAVHKSPVRYSSAFRSKAPVGMEIRPTTSPDHIGPGSFADSLPRGVEVYRPDLNSFFIVKERKMPTRQARPELTSKYPAFADMHTAGPIFNKEGEMSGNVVLQKKVKTKMTQIYPKLADKKFPPQKIKKQKSTKKIK